MELSRRGWGQGFTGCAIVVSVMVVLVQITHRSNRSSPEPHDTTTSRPHIISRSLPSHCVDTSTTAIVTATRESLLQPITSPSPSQSPVPNDSTIQHLIPALGGPCVPIRSPNRVAYAIVYDMSESASQWSLRNAQFSRVFKGLRDTGSKVGGIVLGGVRACASACVRAMLCSRTALGVARFIHHGGFSHLIPSRRGWRWRCAKCFQDTGAVS
jgi:hypothetical protein